MYLCIYLAVDIAIYIYSLIRHFLNSRSPAKNGEMIGWFMMTLQKTG